MKTYNYFRGKQPIQKSEFLANAPENWEDLLNEDNEIICGEFKAVLISEEVTCEECGGGGSFEQRNCNNSSSECCGGCFKDIECSECNGRGIITIKY